MLTNDSAQFSSESIRDDFPILQVSVHPGVKLTYLDSAATSQKPNQVISAMDEYYRKMNANIHRGVHALAEEATFNYENAREKIGKFVGASQSREVIFTRNTTESINILAYTLGRSQLKQGDLIILSEMEHHSNLVPWQILAGERNVHLEFIKVTDEGLLDLDSFKSLLAKGPKLVAFTQMSNVLGTINPVKKMAQMAGDAGAITIIDAAQSVPHMPVNVSDLGADFIAFSAHKMLGPTGIGILWGREELLEKLPPFLGGGDMIKKVYLESFKPNDLPHKFEAGTPAIAEAIGFGAAIDYLQSVGVERIYSHEQQIIKYAFHRLHTIDGLRILGPEAVLRGGVISFTIDGIHPHDIAQIVDRDGIAVRAGHHCAMPLHERFGIPASTRASFYLYNSIEDVDLLINSLQKALKLFG